jgi:EmrB/QacA subfamily drug resistance transporter
MNRPPQTVPNDGRKKWFILGTISVALFMILLDVTIVNIAIPHIMTALKVSLSSIEWVINVYTLVFAVLLLTLGKLGDLFGRRRLFLIGLAIFTLSSLGCSLSPNFTFLLISRGIQAIGGAAMMPATLSILNVEFGQKQRGLALGIWGAVAGAANALGPIIGGALVDAFSWRYIFIINVPIGIAAFIVTILIVRESTDPNANRRIDIPGVIIISLALFCLTYALVEGQKYGWTSATILGLFAVALIGLIVFVIIELKRSSPLAQLRLFRNRTFAAGNVVALVVMVGLIGVIFLLVLFLQLVLGFSAIKAGLTILPLPLVIIAVAPFAGRLTDRIGGRWILFSGTLITAIGMYMMSDLSSGTSEMSLIFPLAICGLGMGLIMAPVTTVVMASTPIQQSGMGAGILSTMRQVGAVMGISVMGAILQSQLVGNVTNALSQIPQLPETIRNQIAQGLTSGGISLGGVNIPGNIPGPIQAQLTALFKTEFSNSLNTAMKVGIVILLVGTVASLFVASHVRKAEKPLETKL